MNLSRDTFLVQRTLFLHFAAGDLIKQMGFLCWHITRTHELNALKGNSKLSQLQL